MSEFFSSETTIKARVKASRINLYGDKDRDGALDPLALEQALSYARQTILMALINRYGSQVEAWDDLTVPAALRFISDDLTIYYLASGQYAVNPVVQAAYEAALNNLLKISEGEWSLPGISDHENEAEALTLTTQSIYADDAEISTYSANITGDV